MKKSIFSPIDPYSLSPLFALIPQRGDLKELIKHKPSLFARYEKVKAIRSEEGVSEVKDIFKKLIAEEEMLKEVLDWLDT